MNSGNERGRWEGEWNIGSNYEYIGTVDMVTGWAVFILWDHGGRGICTASEASGEDGKETEGVG